MGPKEPRSTVLTALIVSFRQQMLLPLESASMRCWLPYQGRPVLRSIAV